MDHGLCAGMRLLLCNTTGREWIAFNRRVEIAKAVAEPPHSKVGAARRIDPLGLNAGV